MNWKKVVLFIFLILVGIALFGIPPLHISLFQPLFFIAYVIFLSLLFKEYSKKKLFILIGLIIVYLVIMLIPFPICDTWEKLDGTSQECTCIGIKKYSFGVYDAGWTQCVGIPVNYRTSTLQERATQQIEQQILEELRVNPLKRLGFLIHGGIGFSLETNKAE